MPRPEGIEWGRQEWWDYWSQVRKLLEKETGLPSRIITEICRLNCTCVEDILKLNKSEALSKKGIGGRIWEEIEDFQNKYGKEMLSDEYITLRQLKQKLEGYNDNDIVLINGNPGVEIVESLGRMQESTLLKIVCLNSYNFAKQDLTCLGKKFCNQCQPIKRFSRIKKDRTWLVKAITRRLDKKTKEKMEWDKVDWRLSDAALAEEYGVTRQRINQMRKRFHRQAK
ncbi:MAG: hypothetical protein RDU30_02775 [Desulfovibrionaceae bacterium]|nr:hypothetical protein [Desulfovibrionaceae bacterium]